MVEVSRDQLVIIENCFTQLSQVIDMNSMPDDLKQQFTECMQLVSGLADKADSASQGQSTSTYDNSGGPK